MLGSVRSDCLLCDALLALGATGPGFPVHGRRIAVRARRAVEVNALRVPTKMDARVEDVPRADIFLGVFSDSRVG